MHMLKLHLRWNRVWSSSRSMPRLFSNRACSLEARSILSFSRLGWDSSAGASLCQTPPSTWYSSPEHLRLEKEHVFDRDWICVGRSSQVEAGNSCLSSNLLGEPFIVLRDDQGVLRAFYNVCRHHAAELIQPGCQKLPSDGKIVCPYHGWTYRADGRLCKATRINGMQNFKANENGLIPLHVCTHGPLLFVSFDETEPSTTVEQMFEPISEELESTGWRDLDFVKRVDYDLMCNWKVVVENYCDGGYHVPFLHGNLNAQLDEDTYETRCFEYGSLQTVTAAKKEEEADTDEVAQALVDFPERIGSGAFYAYLHPNVMINRYGWWCDVNYVYPLSPTRTRVTYDYFFDTKAFKQARLAGEVDDEQADFVDKSLKASDLVQQEDVLVCESVQRGLESKAYARVAGRYAPKVEMALFHFHETLQRCLSPQAY